MPAMSWLASGAAVPALAGMRAQLRDIVRTMETFDALRERVLDQLGALGFIDLRSVADPARTGRAASS
jgi:hypothetical protein